MAFAAIVDTSAMVALFGREQPANEHYAGLFEQAASEQWILATTWPCVVETSHLLGVPQRYAFLRWIGANSVSVYPFEQGSLDGITNLMRRYTEAPRTQMDLADASLVMLAVDVDVVRIMTLDVRDFSRYRLPDGRAFEIL